MADPHRSLVKKIAVFDIDGTLVRWQLYHAIADELAKRGYANAKAYEAIRDARMEWKRRAHPQSFKTYEQQLVSFYDRLLDNLSVLNFNEAADAVFEEYKDQVYVFTRDLIKSLKRDGYLLFALSGSQIEIVEKIASYYGFDDYVGTTYERSGKFFTGTRVTHLGKKHEVLKQLVDRHGATLAGSVGIGDSAGDISMLKAVEKPIAFNPEAKLFEWAKTHGWQIVIERKNVIYCLEHKNGSYQLV